VIVTLRFTPACVVRCLAAAETFWPSKPIRWARALGTAAAGLALGATTVADVPSPLFKPGLTGESRPDPRVARLEKFFRRYHCPAPHHVSEYLHVADGYGLDYRLLPAVSIRETLCGVAEKDRADMLNNYWGYHPGRQIFPSVSAGIEYVARQLAQNPLYKGKPLQDKLFTYNPRPAYPEEIRRIMRQIE
jgi:hypothetical protein